VSAIYVKCFKYRLYPTKAQETALNQTLDTLRDVYNSLLHEREFLYETTGKSPSQYEQEKHFKEWKPAHPELAAIHAHLLQNVALRVNLAFTAFFRRCKSGEKPGYPRRKGHDQYDSFTFKEWGNGVSFKRGNLYVSKIGEIKGKFHRPLEGTPKTTTVRRHGGKWFVTIACECECEPLPPSDQAVGIDVGLHHFAALSNGDFIDNPRFFRRDEKAIAKAQRKQAKTDKGSQKRRKANKVIGRIHERIRNRRHDFVHQTARRIVNQFGLIAVEDLNVKGMVQNRYLAKSISDAAWSMFHNVLGTKAASAGREYQRRNPAYTSQDCYACGHRAKKKLSERWHNCPKCGVSLDRDTNSGLNLVIDAIKDAVGQYSVTGIPI